MPQLQCAFVAANAINILLVLFHLWSWSISKTRHRGAAVAQHGRGTGALYAFSRLIRLVADSISSAITSA